MLKIRVEMNEREIKHKIERINKVKFGLLKRLIKSIVPWFLRRCKAMLGMKKMT